MPNSFDKQRVLTVIEERITPLIGKNMARASTHVQCQKLGITEVKVTITDSEVASLLDRIGKAMMVFVGQDQADHIIAEIHRSIGMGDRPK